MRQLESSGFEPFVGEHCETVATGTLLKAVGLSFSEPMLFGLGQGLSFIILNLSSLPLPFIGGRVKPFELTEALCRNLGISCHFTETSSKVKAWEQLERQLGQGRPVGLQLDCYYLDYFQNAPHFAGHFVAAYQLDSKEVWLVDTVQQKTLQRVPRSSLEAARHAKGPMAARARLWTIDPPRSPVPLEKAVRSAIHANAAAYLSPPFQGMSYLGIQKLASSLPKWLKLAASPERDLPQAALLMERAGTGGSLFRNLYRDFLAEAKNLLPNAKDLIEESHGLFSKSASEWKAVAEQIEKAGIDRESTHLEEAAERCRQIGELEVAAMRLLARLESDTMSRRRSASSGSSLRFLRS